MRIKKILDVGAPGFSYKKINIAYYEKSDCIIFSYFTILM